MALDTKKNHNDIKNEIQNERRSFLKKTAYAAPGLIALGQLARPTNLMADGNSGSDAISTDPNLGPPKKIW